MTEQARNRRPVRAKVAGSTTALAALGLSAGVAGVLGVQRAPGHDPALLRAQAAAPRVAATAPPAPRRIVRKVVITRVVRDAARPAPAAPASAAAPAAAVAPAPAPPAAVPAAPAPAPAPAPPPVVSSQS